MELFELDLHYKIMNYLEENKSTIHDFVNKSPMPKNLLFRLLHLDYPQNSERGYIKALYDFLGYSPFDYAEHCFCMFPLLKSTMGQYEYVFLKTAYKSMTKFNFDKAETKTWKLVLLNLFQKPIESKDEHFLNAFSFGLRYFILENTKSIEKNAKNSEVSTAHYRTILNASDINPTIRTLQNIAEGLGSDILSLYDLHHTYGAYWQ